MHGHQIYGIPPEVLFLPQCTCFLQCISPLKHLFISNKATILKLLRRVESTHKSKQITIIVEFCSSQNACINWLNREIKNENLSSDIVIKDVNECRGLEFTDLVIISSDTTWGARVYTDSSVIDAWTRVTSSLFIINMDGKYHIFCKGLKDALRNDMAQRAIEQEDISYNEFQQLYFSVQNPMILISIFLIASLFMLYCFIAKISTLFSFYY